MKCHNCNRTLTKPNWLSFQSKTINCPFCGSATYAKFSLVRLVLVMVVSFIVMTLISQVFLNDKGILETLPILLVGPLSFYFAWSYKPK